MQKRIIVSILLSFAMMLATLWVISHLSLKDSIDRALENRLKLANIVSNYINALLQSNLTRLYDISLSGAVDFKDGDWEPEKKALKTAYQYSIFTDGIFLLDVRGNIALAYPPGRLKENLLGIPYVREAIEKKKSVVTDAYTFEDTKKSVIFVLAPLRDKNGDFIGLAGGEINPTNYMLNSVIKAVPSSKSVDIELVDSRGTVIASNDPTRMFTCSDHNRFLSGLIASKKTAVATCHHCHTGNSPPNTRTAEFLAFCPLQDASWGVSVREPEELVNAPTRQLKRRFLVLAFISMGSALLLAIGMSKSIVNPIKSLIAATRQIAAGNLKEPVNTLSKNEIGLLSESFEVMRLRLADSIESVRVYNEDLERRVAERTDELQRNRKRLAMLLDEVIEAQEEERKRVARELHDETSQLLAALGMSIEIAALAHGEQTLTTAQIYEMKRKVEQALIGISLIIKDLRPPILDDLGLESAVGWLLERHLAEKGIAYGILSTDDFNGFMSRYGRLASKEGKAELMLFRIIQEAVVNIAKHSAATYVFVYMDVAGREVRIEVHDNGIGFDPKAMALISDREESFGVLGMRERAALLGGRLSLCSRPGEGASVSITIPTQSLGGIYA